MSARTLFDKLWDAHVVEPETAERPAILYVDLHLVHEVTSPQAFELLRERGRAVRRPDRTLATMDHSTPTTSDWSGIDAAAAAQIATLDTNCRRSGIELHDIHSDARGIVHVIGPELGATWPGKTVVCGDSHTSTHGAFGALAFGIGTTEVAHVLATQTVLQRKPRNMVVWLDGERPHGVTAKDVALAVIGTIGTAGGTGHVIEYRGDCVERMTMEERMTLCNLTIEAGARTGLCAPDETTFAYLRGRPHAPAAGDYDAHVARWRPLQSDAGAHYDREVRVEVGQLEPMVTWGTSPEMVVPVTGTVPSATRDSRAHSRALEYMGLEPGAELLGHTIDVVFVGSCTNGRISDLREAAAVLDGRTVADGTRMLVVPGSRAVQAQAAAEGLDRIFVDAGAEWREPGCSMCIAMNGDVVAAGQYAVSTSNRNFEGRQGRGSRTFLASPRTAAACAVRGCIADPREFEPEVVGP